MKSIRFTLPVILLWLAATALAQHEMQASANQPQSAAQESFTQLKSLAGTWQGRLTLDPPDPDISKDPIWVIMRVTSRGNTLVHEFKKPGSPDDTTKDDPVTTFYLDNDHLTLVHYCDAGNRPRMVAKSSLDGKVVDFDLVDVSGSTQMGNMQHATFTVIDANHHTEDWTYMMPGNKPMHAHMDLTRAQ